MPKRRKWRRLCRAVRGAADVQQDSPPGSPRMVDQTQARASPPVRLPAGRCHGNRRDRLSGRNCCHKPTKVAASFDVAVILENRIREDPSAIGSLAAVQQRGTTHTSPATGRRLRGFRTRQCLSRRRSPAPDGHLRCRGRDLESFVADAKRKVLVEGAISYRHLRGVWRCVERSGTGAARDFTFFADRGRRNSAPAGSRLPSPPSSDACSGKSALRAGGRRACRFRDGRLAYSGRDGGLRDACSESPCAIP